MTSCDASPVPLRHFQPFNHRRGRQSREAASLAWPRRAAHLSTLFANGITAYPYLSTVRLTRDIRERGYERRLHRGEATDAGHPAGALQ